MNILLTGRPGVGKSTAIQKLIESIGIEKVGGFWTMEIRVRNRRVGFSIQTTSGVIGTLANVDNERGPQSEKYSVSIEHIDEVAIPALEDARISNKLIIIDEIATMELKSPRFAPEVRKCLDTKRVLGTLQERPGKFQNEVRDRDDTRLIKITHKNRDVIPAQVLFLLGSSES